MTGNDTLLHVRTQPEVKPSRRPPPADVRSLVALSFDGLREMQLGDGTFCLEVRADRNEPIGRSLRYTAMVAIGLERATRAGYDHGFDLDGIRNALLRDVDVAELTPGDLGLYLWLDALRGGGEAHALTAKLRARLDAHDLENREGMEVAWIV